MADLGVSVTELKSKLYSSLRSGGVVDALKTQLRGQIVRELKAHGAVRGILEKTSEQGIVQRAVNLLFMEYLYCSDLPFTVSVFVPESGTSGDLSLTRGDVLHLLRIQLHSHKLREPAKDASRLLSAAGPQSHLSDCLIVQLLEALAKLVSVKVSECASQTSEDYGVPEPLHEKLERVNTRFSEKSAAEKALPLATLEERMAKYQREVDDHAYTEIQQRVAGIREMEIGQMRLEEREKFRQQLHKMQSELENTYAERLNALKRREDELLEECRRREKNVESAAFDSRQRALAELGSLRAQEEDAKRAADLHSRSLRLQEDRVKEREDRAMQTMKDADALRQRLLREAQEFRDRTEHEVHQSFEDKLRAVQRDADRLHEERCVLAKERSEFGHLVAAAHELKSKLSDAQRDLAITSDKLETTAAALTQLRSHANVLMEESLTHKTAAARSAAEAHTLQDLLDSVRRDLAMERDKLREQAASHDARVKNLTAQLEELRRVVEEERVGRRNESEEQRKQMRRFQEDRSSFRNAEAQWMRERHTMVPKLEAQKEQMELLRRHMEDEQLERKMLARELEDARRTIERLTAALTASQLDASRARTQLLSYTNAADISGAFGAGMRATSQDMLHYDMRFAHTAPARKTRTHAWVESSASTSDVSTTRSQRASRSRSRTRSPAIYRGKQPREGRPNHSRGRVSGDGQHRDGGGRRERDASWDADTDALQRHGGTGGARRNDLALAARQQPAHTRHPNVAAKSQRLQERESESEEETRRGKGREAEARWSQSSAHDAQHGLPGLHSTLHVRAVHPTPSLHSDSLLRHQNPPPSSSPLPTSPPMSPCSIAAEHTLAATPTNVAAATQRSKAEIALERAHSQLKQEQVIIAGRDGDEAYGKHALEDMRRGARSEAPRSLLRDRAPAVPVAPDQPSAPDPPPLAPTSRQSSMIRQSHDDTFKAAAAASESPTSRVSGLSARPSPRDAAPHDMDVTTSRRGGSLSTLHQVPRMPSIPLKSPSARLDRLTPPDSLERAHHMQQTASGVPQHNLLTDLQHGGLRQATPTQHQHAVGMQHSQPERQASTFGASVGRAGSMESGASDTSSTSNDGEREHMPHPMSATHAPATVDVAAGLVKLSRSESGGPSLAQQVPAPQPIMSSSFVQASRAQMATSDSAPSTARSGAEVAAGDWRVGSDGAGWQGVVDWKDREQNVEAGEAWGGGDEETRLVVRRVEEQARDQDETERLRGEEVRRKQEEEERAEEERMERRVREAEEREREEAEERERKAMEARERARRERAEAEGRKRQEEEEKQERLRLLGEERRRLQEEEEQHARREQEEQRRQQEEEKRARDEAALASSRAADREREEAEERRRQQDAAVLDKYLEQVRKKKEEQRKKEEEQAKLAEQEDEVVSWDDEDDTYLVQDDTRVHDFSDGEQDALDDEDQW